MADFEFTPQGFGIYTLSPLTDAAIERMGGNDSPVTFDSAQYAQECAAGLCSEGFALTYDGQPLELIAA